MASAAPNKIKYLLALGAANFSSDTCQIILMASGFTFDIDAHTDYGNAAVLAGELPTAGGYTAGQVRSGDRAQPGDIETIPVNAF